MPRDFNTFANEKKNETKENDNVDKYKEIIGKYKDLDSATLMKTLLGEASKLKNEGKLDNSMLSNLKSTLSPFLNDDQRSTLEGLINAINAQK